MPGRGLREPRDGKNQRNKSSSWSSDETRSDDSGSSIDMVVDDRHSFTHNEESRVRRSLQRKLLSNNGVRLSEIERRLLHADHRRKGVVSISTFKAALAAASRSDNGVDIRRDEALWLIRCLLGRNGKNIAIMKMRELLENKEHVRGAQRYHRHRDKSDAKSRSSSRVSQGREERRYRKGESTTDDDGQGWTGRGKGTTSEPDSNGRGGAAFQWQSSRQSPAKWVTRQGTVGQWLHEVAAPMERKLFFEFMKDLTDFEVRNGLDHFRVRPSSTRRRHHGVDGKSGGAGRRCGEDDGTTILHLGPMLKASIRFYV